LLGSHPHDVGIGPQGLVFNEGGWVGGLHLCKLASL